MAAGLNSTSECADKQAKGPGGAGTPRGVGSTWLRGPAVKKATASMRNRLFLAAAASGVALAAVVGVAQGVGHDDPRLVRTAGTSAQLEESSTTSTAPVAVESEKVAELDATVENHEARISQLEATTMSQLETITTTAPAIQSVPTMATTTPAAPAPEPVVSTSTSTSTTTTTTWRTTPTTFEPPEYQHG